MSKPVKKQEKLQNDKLYNSGPYVCTGNFQADFTELCRRNNMEAIPPVVPRPVPPCESSKAEKSKEKLKHHLHGHSHETNKLTVQFENIAQIKSEPAKTFLLKESSEYFKPTVQVKMDTNGKNGTVTEVYIRGWKIDNTMMNIFKQCWPVLPKLQIINLWHAGLTAETVSMFASFLPACEGLKNLILDGNWLSEENWHEIIRQKCSVKNLSLRNCFITDKGAEGIGRCLGSVDYVNTNLLSLNLTGNRITDVGCEYIARGLRLNRTLLTLSLACNQIGDKGCCKLAEILSNFPLTHEEIVGRRKDMSRRIVPVKVKITHIYKPIKKGSLFEKRDRGKHKKPHEEKKPQARKDVRNKDARTPQQKRMTKMYRTSSAVSVASDSSIGKEPKPEEEPLLPEFTDLTLLETAISNNGQLWLPGNTVLISINLSRNRIGIVGVQALLYSLQYQSPDVGLVKLNLEKNYIPSSNYVMIKLEKLLKMKDLSNISCSDESDSTKEKEEDKK